MIPIYSLVSEEDVISRIKFDLRLTDTTEHDTHFEILLREGLGSMNCISQLQKKQCDLPVEDNKVKLEGDLVRFIAARPKTWTVSEDQEENPLRCATLIYADTAFLNQCGCDCNGVTNYRGMNGFQINKGYIHFNSDTSITSLTVAYQGMWLDENGKRAIFERFERALNAYACWKFTRSWPEKYSFNTQESYRMEWANQREKMKGMDVKTEFEENRVYIAGMMRSLITSPIVLIN